MKRSLQDILENLDHVGCDNDTAREMCDEIERLRAFIESLDGKTIAIRGEDNTFIDDGIIVAADILSPHQGGGAA